MENPLCLAFFLLGVGGRKHKINLVNFPFSNKPYTLVIIDKIEFKFRKYLKMGRKKLP